MVYQGQVIVSNGVPHVVTSVDGNSYVSRPATYDELKNRSLPANTPVSSNPNITQSGTPGYTGPSYVAPPTVPTTIAQAQTSEMLNPSGYTGIPVNGGTAYYWNPAPSMVPSSSVPMISQPSQNPNYIISNRGIYEMNPYNPNEYIFSPSKPQASLNLPENINIKSTSPMYSTLEGMNYQSGTGSIYKVPERHSMADNILASYVSAVPSVAMLPVAAHETIEGRGMNVIYSLSPMGMYQYGESLGARAKMGDVTSYAELAGLLTPVAIEAGRIALKPSYKTITASSSEIAVRQNLVGENPSISGVSQSKIQVGYLKEPSVVGKLLGKQAEVSYIKNAELVGASLTKNEISIVGEDTGKLLTLGTRILKQEGKPDIRIMTVTEYEPLRSITGEEKPGMTMETTRGKFIGQDNKPSGDFAMRTASKETGYVEEYNPYKSVSIAGKEFMVQDMKEFRTAGIEAQLVKPSTKSSGVDMGTAKLFNVAEDNPYLNIYAKTGSTGNAGNPSPMENIFGGGRVQETVSMNPFSQKAVAANEAVAKNMASNELMKSVEIPKTESPNVPLLLTPQSSKTSFGGYSPSVSQQEKNITSSARYYPTSEKTQQGSLMKSVTIMEYSPKTSRAIKTETGMSLGTMSSTVTSTALKTDTLQQTETRAISSTIASSTFNFPSQPISGIPTMLPFPTIAFDYRNRHKKKEPRLNREKRFTGYSPSLEGIMNAKPVAHIPKGARDPLAVRPTIVGQGLRPTQFSQPAHFPSSHLDRAMSKGFPRSRLSL